MNKLLVTIIFFMFALLPAAAKGMHPQIAAFWQGKDLQTMPADTIEQMTADYIYIAQHADSITRAAMADTIVAKWSNNKLANTVLDYLGNYDSPMFNEELLIEILQRMNLEASEAVALKYTYNELLKNRMGTLTADFAFIDSKGVSNRLSDVAQGKTMLIFYDPDCDVCHTLMSKLAAAGSLQWKVVAISVDPERLTSGLPGNWINGRADGSELEELYPFSHYPYVMLLDGMTVQTRDANLQIP
ncbi:MAG: hypothetical protein NC343_05345 [Muribaculum sp.]|nr:hypothetical protein [Muribaculaceae bacterium]MCM1081156.1 hypothetical protein [Muribaculum sp.]